MVSGKKIEVSGRFLLARVDTKDLIRKSIGGFGWVPKYVS